MVASKEESPAPKRTYKGATVETRLKKKRARLKAAYGGRPEPTPPRRKLSEEDEQKIVAEVKSAATAKFEEQISRYRSTQSGGIALYNAVSKWVQTALKRRRVPYVLRLDLTQSIAEDIVFYEPGER